MDTSPIVSQLETLIPLAAAWAAEQEERTVREGVPLSNKEMADARAVGVLDPQRVRLLKVDEVPRPEHPGLRAACDAIGFLTPPPRGLTLQYGIFIRSDCWRNRSLIVHELVHTAQYERLGGILPFLAKYVFECVSIGYAQSPLEQEAVRAAERITSASDPSTNTQSTC
jgi:hypothetical protein